MKFATIILALSALSSAAAFHVTLPATTAAPRSTTTARHMFSGAGAGKPKEDNPEEQAQMEQAAKAMGMSVEEYSVAMNARAKLTEELTTTKITTGKTETVSITRDINNPPKNIEIVITEAGKELGKEAVSKELVAAFKSSSEQSKKGRADAQKKMMMYIQEQMKK